MSSPDTPLSPGEMELMEIVWEHEEVSAYEVCEIISERRTVARETVRTMLARMEAKGWLTHRIVGRTYFYAPTVPQEKGLGQRIAQLVDRACGGRPEQLVNALLQYRGLTAEELKRIRELLDAAGPEKQASRRKRRWRPSRLRSLRSSRS